MRGYSSVSIVTTLQVGRPEEMCFDLWQTKGSLKASRPAHETTQPHFYWMAVSLPSKVNRPWREADCSPVFRAEVKNVWNCFSMLYTSLWLGA